jgi:hypothetical protein
MHSISSAGSFRRAARAEVADESDLLRFGVRHKGVEFARLRFERLPAFHMTVGVRLARLAGYNFAGQTKHV